jgi:pre-60S factor REI1
VINCLIIMADLSTSAAAANDASRSIDTHEVDSDEARQDDVVEDKDFTPTSCLFCLKQVEDLEANVDHMRKAHGLFIPTEQLVVDMETLLAYMHLVIFGYYECLECGLQRSSSEAVRQHMMGKGHCAIDLLNPASEYRDFYDYEAQANSAGEEGDGTEEADDEDEEHDVGAGKQKAFTAHASTKTPVLEVVDGAARLPSGKLLSHRNAPRPRPPNRTPLRNPEREGIELIASSSAAPRSRTDEAAPDATALTRAERRGGLTTSRQLSTMRAEDRRSLLHLTSAEQRTVLANQQKQLAKGRRAERAMQARLEDSGNSTLMKHFKPDVPGPKNG